VALLMSSFSPVAGVVAAGVLGAGFDAVDVAWLKADDARLTVSANASTRRENERNRIIHAS
jgi:hypothetical protein